MGVLRESVCCKERETIFGKRQTTCCTRGKPCVAMEGKGTICCIVREGKQCVLGEMCVCSIKRKQRVIGS